MPLSLSPNGFLPEGIYTCTTNDLFEIFVLPFPQSQTRRRLYRQWENYNQRLVQKVGNVKLSQWLNGSFVTEKLNPNDIDCVTFLPYQLYTEIEENLIEFYSTLSLFEDGLDAYFCPVYPATHLQFKEYEQRRLDWQFLFERTRGSHFKKGFLEVTL